ncbi:HNH endonuclease [Oleiagrimonas sp. C23AA]|uniref:HNH endonuclease n=1 Tax=Oleiagrimonas sp. C23AA TaxID=2719047 RepID=UPI0014219A49|nr:HNH endonuclease [Oleiagrimonas sp. C23AA]NII09673.1 hypothetical protein [Oleiagrimonas sp. C23AA]
MGMKIAWQDGYTDLIPRALIAQTGALGGAQHEVIGPKGGSFWATCDVLGSGPVVDLDYTNYPGNARNFPLGELRLTFESAERTGTPRVEWREDGSKKFEEFETSVVVTQESHEELVELFDSDGEPVRSRFSVVEAKGCFRVILESRGGWIGGSNERNSGYSSGLRVLLKRLASRKYNLTDALLAARVRPEKMRTPEERRIHPEGYVLPLELSPGMDTDGLAGAIQRALARVATSSSTGRGNSTRRLELIVRDGAPDLSRPGLQLLLSRGSSRFPITESELDGAVDGAFDPSNVVDARTKVMTALAVRRGQQKFRTSLREAYRDSCPVTGCDVVEVLEAAHIIGYQGEDTNHVQNGLLLRADIHTLFDLGKLGIDPQTWSVVVHDDLRLGPYAHLHGKPVTLPEDASCRPSEEALMNHLESCQLVPR